MTFFAADSKGSAAAAGRRAENAAGRYLRWRGLKPLGRNYRCREGEIDWIMRHGAQLVFVEVRYRVKGPWGTPLETIGLAKQRCWVRAANRWRQRYRQQEAFSRFDVVEVEPRGFCGLLRCRWHRHVLWNVDEVFSPD